METAPQTVARLLAALESLTREEHALLAQGAFPAAVALQTRAQPLVARLTELMAAPSVAAALPADCPARAHALIAAQRAQSAQLAAGLEMVRDQLDQLRGAQTRLRKLRPSYGAPFAAAALSFAGEA